MSIRHTAQSALHSLEELYKAIDLSSQKQSTLSYDDSENLVQALCNLSQLITHANQTGMCGQTPMMTRNIDANRFHRRKLQTFNTPHLDDYDDSAYMDSAIIGPPPPQSGQPYGECVLYHPIRIITTSADGPTVLHDNDFVRRDGQYRKDHGDNKQLSHHRHAKKTRRRRMSKSHDRRSKTSRSRSRGSRMSRRSRRSSRGRVSQSRGRSSRSSRRSSRSSKSGHQRSYSHGRRSRSSQRGSRRSRSSQRRSRSRRRSSYKRQSADRKYHDRQIPSRPISTTTTNPTTSLYPSNQIATAAIGNQPSSQQSQIRSLSSSFPITTTSASSMLPLPSFTPTIPLPPPPAISALHHSSQLQIQPHQIFSSTTAGNNNPTYRSMINPSNDQPPSYQQVPASTTSTGNVQRQQPTSLSSTNHLLKIATQNDILSSRILPLQTTDDTSRSDNCPECRAITRLLQWAPLKCYDAAGIRRGVFLAGPKSEQLLKALYASMKDSSLSFDDIEDCVCDNE